MLQSACTMTDTSAPSLLHTEVCARFNPLATKDDARGLRHVTLLGGYSTPGLYDSDDFFHLELAFHALRENKIALHDRFTIDSINLDRQRRDFLKAPPPTDLLVVCFVHNPDVSFHEACIKTQHRPSGLSELHFVPGIWAKAAEKSGARAIFVNGGMTELSAKDFCALPYVVASESTRLSFNSGLLLREDYARDLMAQGQLPDTTCQMLKSQALKKQIQLS